MVIGLIYQERTYPKTLTAGDCVIYKEGNAMKKREIKRPQKIGETSNAQNTNINNLQETDVDNDIEKNRQMLSEIFKDCSDVTFRDFSIGSEENKCLLVYINGMVKKSYINDYLMGPLMNLARITTIEKNIEKNDLVKTIINTSVTAGTVIQVNKTGEIVKEILAGRCIIYVNNNNSAISINLKSYKTRNIEETDIEPVLRGPLEGFTEDLKTSVTQIRRRIKTPDLKVEKYSLGRLSSTDIAVLYVKGLVSDDVLREIRERINRIDVDVIIESGQLELLIEDEPFSLFPLIEYTQRPDNAVLALSSGRAVIIIDTTPFVLMVPSVFSHFLGVSEDNYSRMFFSIFIKILRQVAFIISLTAPSIYIAVTTFHMEMIPEPLLINLAAIRSAVPFPALVEALLLESIFEILREAGERLPRGIGPALSIVGALVIGQAAVEAGLVSNAMIIVVAITAISSFAAPKFNMPRSVRMIRFPIMFLAAVLGMFGIVMALLFLLVHLVSLRSFGATYFSPFAPLNVDGLKNEVFKLPYWTSTRRPSYIQHNNIRRAKDGMKPGTWRKRK